MNGSLPSALASDNMVSAPVRALSLVMSGLKRGACFGGSPR